MTALVIAALFTLPEAAPIPAPAAELVWNRVVDGPRRGNDEGMGVTVAPDGSVYAVGWIRVHGGGNAAWVAKYAPGGARLWKRTVTGPAGESTMGTAVALGPDGSVHVVGTRVRSAAPEDSDIWMSTYSPDGRVLWARTIDSPARVSDMALAVVAAPDGSLYVTGMAGGAIWLGKFGPGGRRVWSRVRPRSRRDIDMATALALGPDGTVHVLATLHTYHRSRLWLGVWSPDGELLRELTDDALCSQGNDLVVDAAGNDWTVGTTRGSVGGVPRLRLAVWSPRGERLRTDVLPGMSQGIGLALTADGGVLVTGQIFTGTTAKYDLLLRRYTPGGEAFWSAQWDGGGAFSSELANGVALSPDGGMLVVGRIEKGGSDRDILLARFNAAGEAPVGPAPSAD